jgi:hypothetical protein
MSQEMLGATTKDEDEQTLVDGLNQLFNEEKSSSKIFDPDGDALIQLAEVKLQVSSKVLSLASKAWKTIFSPKDSEGNQVHKEEQHRCIYFTPEDDTPVMTALCLVLHHKGQEIIQGPDINELVQLAVLANKYDCAKAMTYYGCSILSGLTRAMDASGLPNNQLLFPSILFEDHYTFERVTRMMVYTKTLPGQKACPSVIKYQRKSAIYCLTACLVCLASTFTC